MKMKILRSTTKVVKVNPWLGEVWLCELLSIWFKLWSCEWIEIPVLFTLGLDCGRVLRKHHVSCNSKQLSVNIIQRIAIEVSEIYVDMSYSSPMGCKRRACSELLTRRGWLTKIRINRPHYLQICSCLPLGFVSSLRRRSASGSCSE